MALGNAQVNANILVQKSSTQMLRGLGESAQ